MKLNNISLVLEFAKNVIQNASVLEIRDFRVGVETAGHGQSLARRSLDSHILINFEVATLHVNIESFSAIETVCIG